MQLIDTARHMILTEGIGAVTMASLADAVGVTKPIVYKHFSNSEDIIIEILEQYARGSERAVGKATKDAESIREFFDALIESLFFYIKHEGAVIRCITNGFSSSYNIDAYFLKIQRRALRVYRHLLVQQGVELKRAIIAAYALMEMINSTILEFASASDDEDVATLKSMVRATLGSLVSENGVRPGIDPGVLDRDSDD